MTILNSLSKCPLALTTVLSILIVAVSNGTAASNDIESFLKAPVWYLEFEVSFTAQYQDSTQNGNSKTKTTISLDRVFSAMWPLDIRMDGLSSVLSPPALGSGAGGSVPSMADQQRMMENMMARMNNAANWMSSGGAMNIPDDATEDESNAAFDAGMKAAMGPGKFDYLRVDIGENLIDEMGNPFDVNTRTTRSGQGTVWPGGGNSITFEIDAVSKKYQLVLPHDFHDMTAKLQQVVVKVLLSKGESPVETRDSAELGLAFYPKNITIDDPKNMQIGMAIIRGDIDLAAGKIVGERTMAAHYEDDGMLSVPGTLTFRYKLSMAPPAKSPASGK